MLAVVRGGPVKGVQPGSDGAKGVEGISMRVKDEMKMKMVCSEDEWSLGGKGAMTGFGKTRRARQWQFQCTRGMIRAYECARMLRGD